VGLFSFDCKCCDHPALCKRAADPEINGWMTDCVVLFANGDRLSGEYDGYGRVGEHDVTNDGNSELTTR
jgi:hypothetical protein